MLKQILKGLPHNTVTRTIFLAAIAIAVLAPLQWFGVMALPVAWVFVAAALTLVTRKVLFTYINLEKLYQEAVSNKNIAAALVFLAVILVMIALIYAGTAVLVAPYTAG